MPSLTKPKPRRVAKPKPPGATDTMLRTSERTMFNRCRQQHHWGYTERLKPRVEAPPLRFGTLIHKALEIYYSPQRQGTPQRRKTTHGEHPADTFLRLYDKEVEQTTREFPKWRDENDEWHNHRELGHAMLTGYIEHFSPLDDEYVVLATEQTFQMSVVTPPSHGQARLALAQVRAPATYVGTFDRILFHRPSKRLMFADYKTTKTDPTKTGHLALDEQAGAYWTYGPLWLRTRAPASLQLQIKRTLASLPPAERRRAYTAEGELAFTGILYDFLRKGLPDDRPRNAEGLYLNKPDKATLTAYAHNNRLPGYSAMKVDELIEVIDRRRGAGTAATLGGVSKLQPPPLFHREMVYRDEADRRNVIERVWQDAYEIGSVRNGSLALKKSPDKFHCNFCAFQDMCELHETGADWQAYRDSMFGTWEPYSDHEIADAEHN